MLTGAYNFRDLGGLPTTDGRRTVHGAIFRSDALDELTPEDAALVQRELGVRRLIDLRATLETEGRAPDWALQAGIEVVSLPLSDAWTAWGELDDEGRRTLLARKYLSYLDHASDNVVAALRAIADGSGPTIFHCAVGKDRTGVLAAVLLSLIGVSREAIVRDYGRTAANMERIVARLAASPVYAERVRTNPAEVYRADEHTMELFLAYLDERDGGAAAWATAHGLAESTIAELRERLTEEAA